jgi:MYXO-CTERM domain-containing protein
MCDGSYTATITPQSVAYGGSVSSTLTSNGVTASGSGDTFNISVPYNAYYNSDGTFINFYPVVTAAATTTAVDTIIIDYTQTFTASDPSNYFYGTYGETIPYVLGSGVMASGFLEVGSTDLPTVSFNGPGSYTGMHSQVISSGLSAGSVTEEYEITFTFADLTPSGTGGSSPAPEPAQMIPAALALAGFGLVALRRRKKEL